MQMRIVDPQNIWKKMRKKSTERHIGCFPHRLSCIYCMVGYEDVFPQENRISQVNARKIYDFAGGNNSSHIQNVHAINYYNERQVMMRNGF